MAFPEPFRVGFVVKRYPHYSETFIAGEIVADEEAGHVTSADRQLRKAL